MNADILHLLKHGGLELKVRLAHASEVPQLRRLLNESYQELLERGLNYTATSQDEAETLKQILSGRGYLFFDREVLIARVTKACNSTRQRRRSIW